MTHQNSIVGNTIPNNGTRIYMACSNGIICDFVSYNGTIGNINNKIEKFTHWNGTVGNFVSWYGIVGYHHFAHWNGKVRNMTRYNHIVGNTITDNGTRIYMACSNGIICDFVSYDRTIGNINNKIEEFAHWNGTVSNFVAGYRIVGH